MLDDILDGLRVGVLRDVLVLQETVLGGPAAAKLDAKLDEAHHDGLQGGEGRRLELAGGDDLAEGGERSGRLSDIDELLAALEDGFGASDAVHFGRLNEVGGFWGGVEGGGRWSAGLKDSSQQR